jgi:pimeloyl-ACP methyl ester carboxylesterase
MELIFFSICLMFSIVISSKKFSNKFEIIYINSHIKNLKLALIHLASKQINKKNPVLFIHGSSFPVELSFGFRMKGYSWMDDLAEAGYEIYGLDFLGYGASDRYPEMFQSPKKNKPVGRAVNVYLDIDSAVDYLIEATGFKKINIIAHSWGGSAAALYAEKFYAKVNKLILFSTIAANKTKILKNEKISIAYEGLTPERRIGLMKNLTPKGEKCRLENEIFKTWGITWKQTALPFQKDNLSEVLFPAGPSEDITDLENGYCCYNPALIYQPVLLIRGEWDCFPSWEHYETLFKSLTNSCHKRYVVIEKGTHVMHLEKSRFQLYNEVKLFLEEKI